VSEEPWYGSVIEINGDWLYLDLRKEGEPDIECEVSVSRWNLQAAEVGSVIVLDTEAQTVELVPPRRWTREEIDKIKADAKAMHERLMRNID
jgi:hypothetical protein